MLYALSLWVLVAMTFGDDNSRTEEIELVSQDSKLVSFYLYKDPTWVLCAKYKSILFYGRKLQLNYYRNTSYFNNIKIDDPMSLEASGFDPAKKITFLVHGFNSNGFEEFPQVMKNGA